MLRKPILALAAIVAIASAALAPNGAFARGFHSIGGHNIIVVCRKVHCRRKGQAVAPSESCSRWSEL